MCKGQIFLLMVTFVLVDGHRFALMVTCLSLQRDITELEKCMAMSVYIRCLKTQNQGWWVSSISLFKAQNSKSITHEKPLPFYLACKSACSCTHTHTHSCQPLCMWHNLSCHAISGVLKAYRQGTLPHQACCKHTNRAPCHIRRAASTPMCCKHTNRQSEILPTKF